MTDRVDATMRRVEKPARDATIDRVGAESQGEQLRSRDDAVLAVRQLSDVPSEARHRFAADIAVE
jgi:hypothetical protein